MDSDSGNADVGRAMFWTVLDIEHQKPTDLETEAIASEDDRPNQRKHDPTEFRTPRPEKVHNEDVTWEAKNYEYSVGSSLFVALSWMVRGTVNVEAQEIDAGGIIEANTTLAVWRTR